MHTDEIFISVIMPAYNGERYMDAAISSVVSQTFSKWELLVIDDGSTDNSYRVILDWVKRDGRIRGLYHDGHQNKGVSASRNLGIKACKGNYIALLDCDDEWLPDKLQKQVQAIVGNPDSVLVYSLAKSIDEDGVDLAESKHDVKFPLICGTNLTVADETVLTGMIRDQIWLPALTVVMKKAAVIDLGGFDETLKYQVEDHLLFTLMAANGRVHFIDDVLAKYRVHATAYTQTVQWRFSMLEYYDRIYKRLPAEYRPIITDAKSRLIADVLLVSPSANLLGFISRNVRLVISQLIDSKATIREKTWFVLRVVKNLIWFNLRTIRNWL